MTIPRPPLESSWRGKSKSVLTIFVKFIFGLSFFKHVKTGLQQKYSEQNRIRLVKYSSAEVTDPSEVPWFARELIFKVIKEVNLICLRSMASCSRVPVII